MRQILVSMTAFWSRVRSQGPTGPAMVILASGAGFVFLWLARELLEGDTFALDRSILLSLRRAGDLSVPIGPSWLTHVITDITSLGGTTVLSLVTIVSVTYLLMTGRRSTALLLLASVIGGWALSSGLKIGIGRPRPDIVPHLIEVGDLSFPSGHAMVSAATYLALGSILSGLQTGRAEKVFVLAVAVVLTVAIGLSRVYLGVHYPSDVVGGWCGGAAWAILCQLVARRSGLAKGEVSRHET
ncbi:phosphatase PAP2 family protein [Rhizobium populisoli]|uniref:phosphatase PAP2 family protein n=1 Tax=Rhizobium populisoli TaxID=2859785 RepID=UPI0028A7A88B|nr:phosphatase PAP2 family protein [Rhizobium populisoli]